MKKLSVILAVVACFGLILGACGSSDNDCDKAANEMIKAMDGACAGKSDTCWSCDCYNQDKVLDVDMTDPMNPVYSCKDPEPCTENCEAPACEGAVLTSAQECLADVTACTSGIVSAMNDGCDATAK
jgi:hypothetical protein